MRKILCFVVVAFISSPVYSDWYEWDLYAYLDTEKSGGIMLEWRIKPGGKSSNTRVQWRVKNITNDTLYQVGIDDKTYYCTNGNKIKRSGETISNKILPSEHKNTMSDALNSKECPNVKSAEFEDRDAIIKIALENNGERYGWGRFGVIKTE